MNCRPIVADAGFHHQGHIEADHRANRLAHHPARQFGGLRRLFGIQSGSPSSYAEEAASTVTFDSAMQLSGVWACVKLLSETVASLPLTVYKTTEKGRKVARTHPLSVLFSL